MKHIERIEHIEHIKNNKRIKITHISERIMIILNIIITKHINICLLSFGIKHIIVIEDSLKIKIIKILTDIM